MKVLLVGGPVESHEIDRMSVALAETGYEPHAHRFSAGDESVDYSDELLKTIGEVNPDIVFTRRNFYPNAKKHNLLDKIGTNYIPEHLLNLGIPVIGSNADVIRKLRVKSSCDHIFHEKDVPYKNDFILIDPSDDVQRDYGKVIGSRGFSCPELDNPFFKSSVLFVKPNSSGRSEGIQDSNVVYNMDELIKRSRELNSELGKGLLLVTPFYQGNEYTVGVIGNRESDGERLVLPVKVSQVEGYSKNKILLEHVKRGGIPSGKVYTERIEDPALVSMLAQYATEIFDLLEVNDYTRTDFRQDSNGGLHAIDVNGVPGLKERESYIATAADEAFKGQENGYSIYGRLISSVIYSAGKRFNLSVEGYPTLFGLKNSFFE